MAAVGKSGQILRRFRPQCVRGGAPAHAEIGRTRGREGGQGVSVVLRPRGQTARQALPQVEPVQDDDVGRGRGARARALPEDAPRVPAAASRPEEGARAAAAGLRVCDLPSRGDQGFLRARDAPWRERVDPGGVRDVHHLRGGRLLRPRGLLHPLHLRLAPVGRRQHGAAALRVGRDGAHAHQESSEGRGGARATAQDVNLLRALQDHGQMAPHAGRPPTARGVEEPSRRPRAQEDRPVVQFDRQDVAWRGHPTRVPPQGRFRPARGRAEG
mmetsp:Transcript_31012/g.84854  ORF Transcript_31012/g.84854 Transcript_31012/m.84854 type:complete len:271 (-) Transcript_31012:1599-2411(-)